MTADDRLLRWQDHDRIIGPAEPGDDDLGPLRDLPGTWVSVDRGWNMIALPFATSGSGGLPYRLLLNQFGETLTFSLVDKGVPNRGVAADGGKQTDQFVVTLDYEQVVHQVAATDRPASTVAGPPGLAIHHEPGLFLNMVNLVDDGLDVARLATIPHGDAALALGRSAEVNGLEPVQPVDGLPVGVEPDLASAYLEPYRHFHDNPFRGAVTDPAFPGFDPTAPHLLLALANQGVTVTSTTVLDLDTTLESAGIRNLPFVVRQADATAMRSTFWIQRLDGDPPRWRLQYLQVVNLEFFARADGLPGRIVWPHVSINTLDKQADAG